MIKKKKEMIINLIFHLINNKINLSIRIKWIKNRETYMMKNLEK